MKRIRRSLTVIITLLTCFIFVPAAFAHPLGNFTINHFAGLEVSRTQITLDFVIDMAEIPAFQEIAVIDANGNGQADAPESEAYHAQKCVSLQPELDLRANNISVTPTLGSSSVEFPPGAGGLPTLRLTCKFSAALEDTGGMHSLTFVDGTYAQRPGWREIVAAADGLRLEGEYTSTSVSNRLTSYPQDLLSTPLDQRELRLGIDTSPASARDPSAAAAPAVPSLSRARSDKFTELVTLRDLTPVTVLFALLVSFVWGALHALTPGHGKTIVGAYLVGSRGTMKHALYLGLTTTITHTLGVFALGLLTLSAAKYIVPERLYPWMGLLSGLLVVGIGASLLASRFKSFGIKHSKAKINVPKSGLSPVFEPAHPHQDVLSAEHLHIHDHSHRHVHRHLDHIQTAHNHSHERGHADHSHMPPEKITWRSLLALGISGGLIPCPSALVVLLGAIALDKIGFGLLLVFAFSLGLAGTLTAIGMLFIYAGRLFERFSSRGKFISLLPVMSALFVSALGAALVWKALGELGML